MATWQVRCPVCAFEGPANETRPGSGCIEVLLWCLLLVPGLLYSLWRSSAARPVCPRCSNPYVVRLSGPPAGTGVARAVQFGFVVVLVVLLFILFAPTCR